MLFVYALPEVAEGFESFVIKVRKSSMNHFYVESDGLKIAAETFGAGAPLVFAHGLTGNRQAIRRQFESLADRYRIVIFDQRGHCDSSPVTDPALYDPSRMADDMRAVLDHLKIDRAIIGGESMGAAYGFALRPQVSAARGKTFAHRARLWR